MANKYKIWDKKEPIITAIGEFLSAEEWMDRHPAAKLDSVTVLCGADEINGSVFATLSQVVADYTRMGCDFSACNTDEEKLAVIEAFEEKRAKEELELTEERKAKEEIQIAALASIAASMEYQNLLTLDDVEE